MSNWQDRFSGIRINDINIDLLKAKLKKEEPANGLRTFVENPLDVQSQLGYKDRRYSTSFDILKRVPSRLSIINGIIQTRCNQVATFAAPFRENKGVGFRITHKEKQKETSRGETEFIKSMEHYIRNCGQGKHNPLSNTARDGFSTFLKKVVRDSLTLDQTCWEIVPDKKGRPYEFIAVDASTIRIWHEQFSNGGHNNTYMQFSSNTSNIVNQQSTGAFVTPVNTAGKPAFKTLDPKADFYKRPAYVQLLDGKIENVYSRDELAFCIRNPRTDLAIMGYGYSEIEMLIDNITNHLNAETHNAMFFRQGTTQKGIINFKGDAMTPDMLESFKRMWRSELEGVNNSHRTAVTQAEGIEWIDMQSSNREMEYAAWVEYLIKSTCAVYQIDPAELNFDMHGGVQQTPLFESSQEWKLKASRDKGLRPLLRFIADEINKHVVSKIDDDFVFEFIGLDEPTEKEKHDMRKEQVASYLTLNEVRRAEDLPDLPEGDKPMNPVYIQLLTLKQQEEATKQQAAAAAPPPGGAAPPPGGAAGAPPPGGAPEDDTNDHVPEYSDSFNGN
jgi:hypothetical protein